MTAAALVALAAACAALAFALRRARREADELRRRADDGAELLHALSDELNRARAEARRPAPAPAAPHRCERCAAVELADAIFAQPCAPLYTVEPAHRRGSPRLVFAVRWGDA